MKSNRVTQIAVAVMMLCAVGCNRDELLNTPDGESQGEQVKVAIEFRVDDFVSPDNDGKTAGAKSTTTERVIHSERSGSMLVELVESPIDGESTPETRAIDVNETEIADGWLFQYNGTTADAILTNRVSLSYIYSTSRCNLITGTNQRLVVVTNQPESFSKKQIVGSSTYQDLLNTTQVVTDEASIMSSAMYKPYIPMTANFQGDIKAGDKLSMTLRYNIAKIRFNLKLGDARHAPSADMWTAQMCDVANISHYVPHSDLFNTDPQPTDAALGAPVSYKEEVVVGMNSDVSKESIWYVPMNRRGSVKNTTPNDRKTKAPSKSTYVRVKGVSEAVDGFTTTYTYDIHLGANFTDDYNLNPHCLYTYNITLYTDPNKTDKRLEVVTEDKGLYLGLFGGSLSWIRGGYSYTNGLYMDESSEEVTGKRWSSISGNHSKYASSEYGSISTWKLCHSHPTQFEAAAVCMNKNTTYASADDRNYIWFLPSSTELLSTWLMQGAINPEQALKTSLYWSSTQENDEEAWAFDFNRGQEVLTKKVEGTSFRVRCFRDGPDLPR